MLIDAVAVNSEGVCPADIKPLIPPSADVILSVHILIQKSEFLILVVAGENSTEISCIFLAKRIEIASSRPNCYKRVLPVVFHDPQIKAVDLTIGISGTPRPPFQFQRICSFGDGLPN
jgi:hypothetical protein